MFSIEHKQNSSVFLVKPDFLLRISFVQYDENYLPAEKFPCERIYAMSAEKNWPIEKAKPAILKSMQMEFQLGDHIKTELFST